MIIISRVLLKSTLDFLAKLCEERQKIKIYNAKSYFFAFLNIFFSEK